MCACIENPSFEPKKKDEEEKNTKSILKFVINISRLSL